MRRRLAPLALASSLLTACAGLDDRSTTGPVEPAAPPATADEALASAQDAAKQGRWGEAQEQLASAMRRFPQAAELAQAQTRMAQQWRRAERTIKDQILVSDAENQHAKLALLDQWILAQPDNLVLASRRLYWREVLADKAEDLTACSEYHAAANPGLARRCLAVAAALAPGAEMKQRLAEVETELAAAEQQAAKQRRAHEEQQRRERVQGLLEGARTALQTRDYRRALDILEQAAELRPDNAEVLGLREEAWSMISPQVEALVKLGDHLYLDEQLDAALATWRAALDLKPEDEDIRARIERAKTVLIRLDALRRQQKTTASP